jgi:serine/threonine protein kinase
VALKVLHPSVTITAEHLDRFNREARATGALNHPNIRGVFDAGVEGGIPYVISELLEGESLRERLDKGPLPYRKALEYGIQIAQALGAAHASGIYHRDVKPANVFITDDGRVKLLDFGLAKLTETDEPPGSHDDTAGRQPAGRDPRHCRLHVAGAGARSPRGPPDRPLLAGHRPLRDVDRHAHVPARVDRRDSSRRPARGAPRPRGAQTPRFLRRRS